MANGKYLFEIEPTLSGSFYLIVILALHMKSRSLQERNGLYGRTGIFLPGEEGGAVNHLPKKFSQVALIFAKQSNKRKGSYDATT